MDVWASEFRLRFGGQPIAVALEQSRGPLVFPLTKYEHPVIFPVHPTVLVNYRKSFHPSGAKDDETAHGMECYSGIAPVVASSGQQCWVHWRWACPKFRRQTFHEWALHSIAYSQWAREYYEQQRAKGKRRKTAIRSLAFKWIRVLFGCWKERKPYDEAVYRRALQS